MCEQVSNTYKAAALRAYRLRFMRRQTGIWRTREKTSSELLFPGVPPKSYQTGESMSVYVDLVDSLHTSIPYEYYGLPACSEPYPTERERQDLHKRQNLGACLQGHNFRTAPFPKLRVKTNMGCTPKCVGGLDSKTMRRMRRLIDRQYRVQLTLDHLPVLTRSKERNHVTRGYPLGFQSFPATVLKAPMLGEFYLFNHFKFVITYQEDPSSFYGVRITGFDVHPMSINHELPINGSVSTCSGGAVEDDPDKYFVLLRQNTDPRRVVYSYEVEWVESELPWSDRWDVYLLESRDDHYYHFKNSSGVYSLILFMLCIVGIITRRSVRNDIAKYNSLDDPHDRNAGIGWNLVHGDVFRPPITTDPLLLSVLCGTGFQIGSSFALTVLASMANMFNPVEEGQALAAMLMSFALCGGIAGYVSSYIYKLSNGKKEDDNVIMTVMGLLGPVLAVLGILNGLLINAGAAKVMSTLVLLFFLFLCAFALTLFKFTNITSCRAKAILIAIMMDFQEYAYPSIFLFVVVLYSLKNIAPGATTVVSSLVLLFVLLLKGCMMSFLVATCAPMGSVQCWLTKCRVPTNPIPRVVPPLPFYADPKFTCIVGGLVPFGTVYLELHLALSELWHHHVYFAMGSSMLVAFILLTATCAQVSMVLTYVQLRAENHSWWWSSFGSCASAGLYVFLYAIWFLQTRLELIGFLSVFMYLCYTGLMAVCMGLYCGAVGFWSSLWFVQTLYNASVAKNKIQKSPLVPLGNP